MRLTITVSPITVDVASAPSASLGLVIGPVTDRPRARSGGIPPMPVAVTLTDIQETPVTLIPKDEEGNPAVLAAAPSWTSSDPSVATVTPAADGMSAIVASVGPLGTATIGVSAPQADANATPLSDSVTVTVVASQPSSLNATPGTPVQRPGT